MAYQPKSYKKFVATAATATLVASAVAPVAFAAKPASEFTDVAPQYKEAVDYLIDNTIVLVKHQQLSVLLKTSSVLTLQSGLQKQH
jgi:hypothetical protein